MQFRAIRFGVLCSSVLISGCANFSSLSSRSDLRSGQAHWVVYDSSRRGAYLTTGADGEIKGCSEPFPDTAFSFKNAIDASVKSSGVDAAAKAEITANALELAGRDRNVLIAREGLYRLCEAGRNAQLKPGEFYDGFQEIMYYMTIVAQADRAKAISKVGAVSDAAAQALSREAETTTKQAPTRSSDK